MASINQKGFPAFSEPQLESLELILNTVGVGELTADAIADTLETAPPSDLARIQASVSGGRPNPPPRALYFDRLAAEKPQPLCHPGVGAYAPRGDVQHTVTCTSGSRTITWTGGAAASESGTGAWMGVVLNTATGKYESINIISRAGNDWLCGSPLTFTGSTVLGSYWEAVGGQHVSPLGGMAIADMIFDASPYSLAADTSIYAVDSSRGGWYSTPWASPSYSPQYWRQYGGLPNNQAFFNSNDNLADPTSRLLFSSTLLRTKLTNCTLGQGGAITVQMGGSGGVLNVDTAGGNSAADVDVVALADGVQIYAGKTYAGFKRHTVAFGSCQSIEIRVTSAVAGPHDIHCGRVDVVLPLSGYNRAIVPGDVLLPVGDSWTDEGGILPRPEIVSRLRSRASAIGATVLPSVGVGGTTSQYWLDTVSGVRRIDAALTANPDCTAVLVHSYINDKTFSISAAQWSANISEIVRTCISAGKKVIVMLPASTASDSQTQQILTTYGGLLGKPVQIGASITACVDTELAGVGSFVNKVGKTAGRGVRVVGAAGFVGTYVARGSAAADPWDCITVGAMPATVTPA